MDIFVGRHCTARILLQTQSFGSNNRIYFMLNDKFIATTKAVPVLDKARARPTPWHKRNPWSVAHRPSHISPVIGIRWNSASQLSCHSTSFAVVTEKRPTFFPLRLGKICPRDRRLQHCDAETVGSLNALCAGRKQRITTPGSGRTLLHSPGSNSSID
jgi:hypothetical protein